MGLFGCSHVAVVLPLLAYITVASACYKAPEHTADRFS